MKYLWKSQVIPQEEESSDIMKELKKTELQENWVTGQLLTGSQRQGALSGYGELCMKPFELLASCPQFPRCTVPTPRNTGEGQTISYPPHTYWLGTPWVCNKISVSSFTTASDGTHDSDWKMPWATQMHPSRKHHHTSWLRVSDQWRGKFPFLFSVNSQFSPDPFPKEKEYPVSSGNALLWAVNSCKDLEHFQPTFWWAMMLQWYIEILCSTYHTSCT